MADFFFRPSGKSKFFFSPSSKNSPRLTLNQQVAIAALSNKDKNTSILGSIYGEGKSALGWTLRQISRPSWGVAEGTRRALEGEGFDTGDFFKGFSRGVQAKKHTTFSDVFKQEGILKGHGRLRAVAGFGADVATDPTLLLTVGATVATGGLAAPLVAGRMAMIAAAKSGDTSLMRQALKHADDAFKTAPDISKAHRAWIRSEKAKIERIESGGVWDELDEARLGLDQEGARVELETYARKVLQPQLALPRGIRVPLLPKALGPTAPSLTRTAAGKGIIGKLPFAAATASGLGKAFKHGFESPEFAKPALAAKHAAENLMDHYSREAGARFKPYSHLTEEDRLKALQFGEETVGIVKGNARQLDETLLARAQAAGELTSEQVGFLRQWNDYTNMLRARDKQLGIEYKKELDDIIYVPHIYTRDGGVASSSVLSQAGYTMERTQRHSIAELKALKEKGDLASTLNLDTDIMSLLASRTRRAAVAHSRKMLMDHMRRVHGTIARVPDVERMIKAASKVDELITKQKGLKTHDFYHVRSLRAANSKKVLKKQQKALDRAQAIRQKRYDEIDALFVEHGANVMIRAYGGEIAKTPTFKNMTRFSEKRFEKGIARFNKADRLAARKVKSVMAEVSRIRRELDKLPAGIHGSRHKELWKQAAKLQERLNSKPLYGGEYVRGENWKNRLIDELGDLDRVGKERWDAIAKKYPNDRQPPSEAVLKNLDRAKANADKKYEERVRRITEAAIRDKNRFENELADKFDREAIRMERLQHQIDRLDTMIPNLKKANPEVDPSRMLMLDSKLEGERYYFKPEVHRAIGRVERILDDDEVMSKLVGTSRKMLAYWKLGVTSVNPGYRVRNTLSDLWNMYIAGVPSAQIGRYGYKAAVMQTRAAELGRHIAAEHAAGRAVKLSKSDRQILNTLNEAYGHGVLSGLFAGDIQTVAAMYRTGSFTKAFIEKNRPDQVLIRWSQTFNRNGENWGRLTHYLYRREWEKKSATDSALWVKKAHFDYEELTPFEQNKLKAFLPFYTWTRKNIPYQLTQLATRPGKYATFGKAIGTSNELATGDNERLGEQEGLMPEFMRDKLAFRIPGGENSYLVPQIGIADLTKLTQSPMRSIGEMARPEFRVLFETATGRSMLTGQEINDGRRKPISDFAGSVLQGVPGSDVGRTSRMVRGERVEGTGANPWVGYIAGQLPWLNQIVNREATIKEKQANNPWASRLSFFGGVSTYDRDLETELTVAQLEWQEEMQRLMKRLRDEGIIAPAKANKPSQFQSQINTMLKGG